MDLKTLRFEELEQGNPVDAGGFQSDRLDATFLQPRDDLVKIGGVGAELADRVGVAVRWDADHMHVGMDVDSGRVRVDVLQRGRRCRDGDGKRPLTRLAGFGWLSGFGWPLRLVVGDDHECLRLEDAGRERTKCRVPRGVSGTLKVSPTGSIPRRENPAWQVTKEKVEASRAMLIRGQEAPGEIRPQTRDTRAESKGKQRREPDP